MYILTKKFVFLETRYIREILTPAKKLIVKNLYIGY
jgi:hypothetical protein